VVWVRAGEAGAVVAPGAAAWATEAWPEAAAVVVAEEREEVVVARR
jgi:hypothetical protein